MSFEGITKMNEVNFNEWEKLDLRVAEILNAEDIEGADKLYKLNLDVGELGERVVCAGIKKYYKKSELKGKKIIYFSNLSSRMMRGIESHGMILAAVSEDKKEGSFLRPEKNINAGTKIS